MYPNFFFLHPNFNFGFSYVKCFIGFIITSNTVSSIRRILLVGQEKPQSPIKEFQKGFSQ